MTKKKTRLLCEDDVIKAVDKHTKDDGSLDDDISYILEEVKDVVIVGSKESMNNLKIIPRMDWNKCVPGQTPEDDERYKGQKVINVDATLLSAIDAYQKTKDNLKKCTTKELAEISKKISEAIENGKYEIGDSGYLQPETRQRLEELGYKISNGSQYNEPYWTISWH